MSQRSEGKLPPMEDVSALVDGELDESAVARACAQWRDDTSAREAWHTYQLIGDVLRSDDLASTASRDSAFLASLRERLATEPVVLAPQPALAPVEVVVLPAVANGHAGRRQWRTPAAVVAGFAVVASVLVVTRMPVAGDAGTVLAAAGNSNASATLVSASSPAPGAVQVFDRQVEPVDALDGQLVRDARLDEYLAAHKKFGGSSGPGVPSGFLRNAAATTGR